MPASFFRLPLQFDTRSLQADLRRMAAADWRAHFNAQYHDGGWSGIALRSLDGNPANLYPGPVAGASYADTPLLATLPNIRAALAQFRCPLEAVRLLRLMPGGQIHEHRDYGLGIALGTVRLHIPVITAADVEFYVDGMRVPMQQGECWYLDLSLPHRVQNSGKAERIHLVLDCSVDAWLRSLFPSEAEVLAQRQAPEYLAAVAVSSRQQFEEFRTLVLDDLGLQERLRRPDDVEEFIGLAVLAGREAGFRFTEAEVRAAIQRGRRAAIERMIVQ